MFTKLSAKISAIPTTLITGFLGSGKTTAILQLLANKPQNETWAVLVNEFGEIGIDSSLLSQNSHKEEVFIREVPGGCMCCASGVPMQVALNQLISKSKPDRLIIEPTGLGHPKEVVEVLTKGNYQDTITLQAILCLVDARNLNDTRYTQHPTFIEQLNIADIIIGAKADKYSVQDNENLSSFIHKNDLTEKSLYLIEHGKIEPKWLLQQHRSKALTKQIIGIATKSLQSSTESKLDFALKEKLKQNSFIELTNHGEGYFSKGWIFSNTHLFNYQKIIKFIASLNVARTKGVVLTEKGHYSFNKSGKDFNYEKSTYIDDSRIELIDTNENILNNIDYKYFLSLKHVPR